MQTFRRSPTLPAFAAALLWGVCLHPGAAAAQHMERDRPMRDDRVLEDRRDGGRHERDGREMREERRRSARELQPGEEERVKAAIERMGFRDVERLRARPRHVEAIAYNRRGDRFEIEVDRRDYEVIKLERDD